MQEIRDVSSHSAFHLNRTDLTCHSTTNNLKLTMEANSRNIPELLQQQQQQTHHPGNYPQSRLPAISERSEDENGDGDEYGAPNKRSRMSM